MKPQQERARRTRRAILDAAMKRFAVDGYRGTSVASIAADAGMTDAGLLYHFATKEDLLFAVLVEHDTREQTAFDSYRAEQGIEFLRNLRRWGDRMEEMAGFTTLQAILSAEHVMDDSRVNRFFRRRYEYLFQWLADAFESAKASGHVRSDVDSFAEAIMFVSLVEGTRLLPFYTDGKVSIADTVRKYAEDLLARITTEPAERDGPAAGDSDAVLSSGH